MKKILKIFTVLIILIILISLVFFSYISISSYMHIKESEKFAEEVIIKYVKNKNSQFFIDNSLFTNEQKASVEIKTAAKELVKEYKDLLSFSLVNRHLEQHGFYFGITKIEFKKIYPRIHYTYNLNFKDTERKPTLYLDLLKIQGGWRIVKVQIGYLEN